MRGKRIGIPLAEWPLADRAAWAAATVTGELFDESGPAAGWAQTTRKAAIDDYGQWLAFLAQDEPGCLHLLPRERTTPARIARYLRHLETNVSSGSVHSYISHLRGMLRVIAPGGWDWLVRLDRDLARRIKRGPKRHRMVSGRRLVDLGVQLMESAVIEECNHDGILQYRDGLIIALLGLRPLRRANLAELRLETSFVENATGYSIHLAAAQIKNRRPFEIDIPDMLRVYVDRYLDAIRPRFPKANQHSGLWASLRGVPMSGDAIYNRVLLHTRAAFGKAINLHLFRDIAATTIALETPGQVRAAAALLGHASLTTTHHHYIQANMVEASRRYGNLIEKLRAGKPDPA
jgi:integrase/recombinase XerD